MIVAALILLAVGAADLSRQFVRRAYRNTGLAVVALAVILIGIFSGAWLAGFLAVAVAAAWIWLLPDTFSGRARFWPVIALAVLCGGFVAALGSRADAGVIGTFWRLPSPWGVLSIDQTLLALAVLCFLLESGNVVVRAALAGEKVAVPPAIPGDEGPDSTAASDPDAAAAASATRAPAAFTATSTPPPGATPRSSSDAGDDRAPGETAGARVAPAISGTLKGGRLIGPLERLLVFALTLAGVHALLAAILAAKGIVRFPEISRDGDAGNRAEYFLVGSFVSWVVALAAALLVWWGFVTP